MYFIGISPVLRCCMCGLVTNNLYVSTWTGTEKYCRAEAMGVILGLVDSTIVETKQKNLLSGFPGVQTDLVGCTSRLRVKAHGNLHILMVQ